ncbi:MAG: Antitoxin HigA [Cyanobacteriota bacterium]
MNHEGTKDTKERLNIVKINGKMTLTFDRNTYSQLLADIAPQVIETEEDYERLLKVA